MTTTQIDYWSLQENKRHNVATEGETHRHNVADENVKTQTLSETIRHNQVTEGETFRHNQATENISWGELTEKTRHNKETESISWGELKEKTRHNKVSEKIDKGNLTVNQRNAATNQQNAATNRRNASTNAKNAVTNARQAAAAEKQAETQRRIAEANIKLTDLKAAEQSLDNIIKSKDLENYNWDKVLDSKGVDKIAKAAAAWYFIDQEAGKKLKELGFTPSEQKELLSADIVALKKYYEKNHKPNSSNVSAIAKKYQKLAKELRKWANASPPEIRKMLQDK